MDENRKDKITNKIIASLRFKKAMIAVRFVVSLMDMYTYQPSKYRQHQRKRMTNKILADRRTLQQLLKTDSNLKVQMMFNLFLVTFKAIFN